MKKGHKFVFKERDRLENDTVINQVYLELELIMGKSGGEVPCVKYSIEP